MGKRSRIERVARDRQEMGSRWARDLVLRDIQEIRHLMGSRWARDLVLRDRQEVGKRWVADGQEISF